MCGLGEPNKPYSSATWGRRQYRLFSGHVNASDYLAMCNVPLGTNSGRTGTTGNSLIGLSVGFAVAVCDRTARKQQKAAPVEGRSSAALQSWMLGSSPPPGSIMTINASSRTPRRCPARVALHASAVAHQGEVAAFAAHLAFVAFGFCLGPAFGF